jgi:protein O-GlcNAc transferase
MEDIAGTTNSLLTELRTAVLSGGAVARLQTLGAQLHQSGQREAALRAFELACENAPEHLDSWLAVAALRLELKLPHAALKACNFVLKLAPDHPQALYSTGVVLAALGDSAAALHCYDKTLSIQADHYGALRNRPMLLTTLGRMDEARQAAQNAVAAYPQDAWLHSNLGEMLLGMQAALEAAEAFQQALALAPDFHQARYALAIALAAQGRVNEAYTERVAALEASPSLAESYQSPLVLDALYGTNDVSPERIAVIAAFEAIYCCNWQRYSETSRLYAELVQGQHGNASLNQHEMPYLALGLPVGDAIRRQVARQAAARVLEEVRGARLHRPRRSRSEKISIGYLSANFGPHPSAQLMGGIYARHDRSRFKVHAYSMGMSAESVERSRVQAGVDVFRDVQRYPAAATAQLIINDGIDILIDLSGFTKGARPEILALRPAPIQVSYMDFIGTMGAEYIDYALLDHNILSPACREFWGEKIAYLPNCSYHCEMPSGAATCSRVEAGLPAAAVVLGALHHPRKLDPDCFSVWLDLLKQIPDSILWLLYESNEQIDNLRRLANENGVSEQRLIFAPFVEHQQHLSRLALVDIFLDTFHYNGHTTTIDALSAGVPVVTLQGDSAVARVAASMLKAHGVPELVAGTVDEYKALICRLANEPDRRQGLRSRIADYASSNLFCPETRVREIEAAYEMMWARHQAGLLPADFDVPEWKAAG